MHILWLVEGAGSLCTSFLLRVGNGAFHAGDKCRQLPLEGSGRTFSERLDCCVRYVKAGFMADRAISAGGRNVFEKQQVTVARKEWFKGKLTVSGSVAVQ